MIHHFIYKIMDAVCTPIQLRFDQSDPSSGLKLKNESEFKRGTDEAGVYCKQCQNRITHPSHAIEMQGTHHHVFTNPEGVIFEIGLYDQAECLAISPAVLEHTWFAGYAWQIMVCAECTLHLGWSYSKHDSPAFYGLILDRIIG